MGKAEIFARMQYEYDLKLSKDLGSYYGESAEPHPEVSDDSQNDLKPIASFKKSGSCISLWGSKSLTHDHTAETGVSRGNAVRKP